jgi:hypothetical protein
MEKDLDIIFKKGILKFVFFLISIFMIVSILDQVQKLPADFSLIFFLIISFCVALSAFFRFFLRGKVKENSFRTAIVLIIYSISGIDQIIKLVTNQMEMSWSIVILIAAFLSFLLPFIAIIVLLLIAFSVAKEMPFNRN